ncbi:hypothetical protein DFH08DRAFT_825693 [Mycena albidolilacea]|uniref:Uncharacterized protein n=1 Tax=Mycena albidolilacea TaxID=1033008 RepID=A0AAD7E8W9_9AGAR|nr:hypothetical protein DFH08DRAFT_825693 [Mycena albidolilacea]
MADLVFVSSVFLHAHRAFTLPFSCAPPRVRPLRDSLIETELGRYLKDVSRPTCPGYTSLVLLRPTRLRRGTIYRLVRITGAPAHNRVRGVSFGWPSSDAPHRITRYPSHNASSVPPAARLLCPARRRDVCSRYQSAAERPSTPPACEIIIPHPIIATACTAAPPLPASVRFFGLVLGEDEDGRARNAVRWQQQTKTETQMCRGVGGVTAAPARKRVRRRGQSRDAWHSARGAHPYWGSGSWRAVREPRELVMLAARVLRKMAVQGGERWVVWGEGRRREFEFESESEYAVRVEGRSA